MKSRSAVSAQCMSSKTSTTGAVSLIRSKKSRQAENRSARSTCGRSPRPSRWRSSGSTHSRSPWSVICSSTAAASFARRALLGLVLRDPRPHPHHLGQRPEGDALAVGEAAAAVPPDDVGEAVDVLLELPREPRLADAGDADDRGERRPPVVARGVEEVLDEAELAVAPDERRLERARPSLAAAIGDDTERAPEMGGFGLALELVLAGVLVGDGRLGCALRGLADEHRARLGRRLDARRGVDEVARDHALALGAERDRRLAGEDAGAARWQRLRRGRHGGDEVERRPHGALGVVLLRDRRPPHRHHRVADELLDGAAVALDERPRGIEVAGEELARLLGVAALGGGREADEVGEEDGDEPPLGGR